MVGCVLAIPRVMRDAAYVGVAGNRYRLFGCRILAWSPTVTSLGISFSTPKLAADTPLPKGRLVTAQRWLARTEYLFSI